MLMSPSIPSEMAPEPARRSLGEVEPRAKHAAAATVRFRRRRVPVAGRRGRRVRRRGRGGRGRGVTAAVAVVSVRLGVVAAVVRRRVVGWLVVGLMVGLVVVAAAVVRRVFYGGVALAAAAVHGLGVVARAEVLVEDGAVAALERLLAAVRVAEVVDLQSSRRRERQ